MLVGVLESPQISPSGLAYSVESPHVVEAGRLTGKLNYEPTEATVAIAERMDPKKFLQEDRHCRCGLIHILRGYASRNQLSMRLDQFALYELRSRACQFMGRYASKRRCFAKLSEATSDTRDGCAKDRRVQSL
jgi:hypothetical protein